MNQGKTYVSHAILSKKKEEKTVDWRILPRKDATNGKEFYEWCLISKMNKTHKVVE